MDRRSVLSLIAGTPVVFQPAEANSSVSIVPTDADLCGLRVGLRWRGFYGRPVINAGKVDAAAPRHLPPFPGGTRALG